MRRTSFALRRLLLPFASAAALSCGDSTDPGPQVVELEVTPEAITLPQKGEQRLAVAALDAEGLLVTGVSIKFTSSDPEMLEVTSTGLVKAIGRAGSYYVRVTSGRAVEDVTVNVTPVIVGIDVTPPSVVVEQNGTAQVTPVLRDINGFAVEDATFTYTVWATELIAVSTTGVVTSLGPRGTASFFVRSTDGAPPGGQWVREVGVTITGVPTTLIVAPNPANVAQGRTYQLQAVVRDAYGEVIPGHAVTFSGGASGIGSVSASGLVTAGETLGSFTVTASAGSLTAQTVVNVVEPSAVQRPNGTLTHTIATASGEGYGVTARNGIAYVAHLGGGLARVDLATFEPLGTIAGYFADVRVDEAGTMAFTASGRGVSFIELGSGAVVQSVSFNAGDVWSLELSDDEERIFVGGAGAVWVVDAGTRTVLKTLTGLGDINHLHRAPGSSLIYASSFTSATVHEIDAGTMSVNRSFLIPGGVQGAAVSPDGATLYVAQEGARRVARVDLVTGAIDYSADIGVGGFGLTLTRDGTQVYVGGGGGVAILDAATLEVLSTIGTSVGIRRVATTEEGAMVLLAGYGSLGIIE